MFSIAATPFSVEDLKASLVDERAGALATFEGWVRNNNEGHSVQLLEYEAYEELCLKEAEKIFAEAVLDYDILAARCVHRVGALKPGELAVWVGATAGHRGDAFAACHFIIDQIKARLPIWKKETYDNGQSDWVNCQSSATCMHRSDSNSEQHLVPSQAGGKGR